MSTESVTGARKGRAMSRNEEQGPELFIGRKAICRSLDCNWATVKARARRWGLTIRHFENGQPFVIKSELISCLLDQDKKNRAR